MSEFEPVLQPERNPVTHQIHRREVLWQVTVPLIVAILVVLALMALAVVGSPASASTWADISLIWLIIPAMFGGLVVLIITAALAYGIIWLVRNVPIYTRKVQAFMANVAVMSKRIGDKVVAPIMAVQGFSASARAARQVTRRQAGRE